MIFSRLTLFAMATGLVRQVLCSPVITTPPGGPTIVPRIATLRTISFPTASGGALDPTPVITVHVNAAQITAAPPSVFHLTIVNHAGVDLSTIHQRNPTGPAPIGNPGPGVLRAGHTVALTMPKGWGGMVAFNRAGSQIVGDESLIEGSFVIQPAVNSNDPIVAVDVSFVAGFSYPIVCTCPKNTDPAKRYLSDCNKPMFDLGTCPDRDNNRHGSCRNPLRGKVNAPGAAPFFEPCEHKAYTYEKDIEAESNGECLSAEVVCVVFPNGR